jgi:hypothetical protein
MRKGVVGKELTQYIQIHFRRLINYLQLPVFDNFWSPPASLWLVNFTESKGDFAPMLH